MRASELASLIVAAYEAADHPEVESAAVSRNEQQGSLTVNLRFTNGASTHNMLAFRVEGPGGRKLAYKDHEVPKEMW